MSSYRAVPCSKNCETVCLEGGEEGDPGWAFTIEYPVVSIMEARHIFTDYHHSWGYFQISFGDELNFTFSVNDLVTRLPTTTFTFECQPSSQGDLQRSFQHRLEALNYTTKTQHAHPAAMLACLCGPDIPPPCFSMPKRPEDVFFSPHDVSIRILHDTLKKQKAEKRAMAGIKVMSSIKFPTFSDGAQESINPI